MGKQTRFVIYRHPHLGPCVWYPGEAAPRQGLDDAAVRKLVDRWLREVARVPSR